MKPDAYLTAVAALGCMVCGQPAQIHHAKGGSMRGNAGMGLRSADDLCIPLCLRHHTGEQGIHVLGVLTWEAMYGSQRDMLAAVFERLETTASNHHAPKRRPILSKILPRVRA